MSLSGASPRANFWNTPKFSAIITGPTGRRSIRRRAAGKDLVLDIDVQGAAQLKKRIPDAVTIFVLAPSREILEQRLRARSQDSDEVIRRRLDNAAREIRNYSLYDYVLVNQDLDLAVESLKAIVRAERVRRIRVEEKIRPILATFGQDIEAV